jgi:hypothetical protein
MRTLDIALLRTGLVIGGFFAFLIAIEAGLLSARFRGEGMLFRWQLWLLAGIFVVTVRDQLASMRCRTCRQWKAPSVRELFGAGMIICQSCREVRQFSSELNALPRNRSSEGILL